MTDLYESTRDAISKDKPVVDIKGERIEEYVNMFGMRQKKELVYVWDALDTLLEHLKLEVFVEESINKSSKCIIRPKK